jgi:hypothetical protein
MSRTRFTSGKLSQQLKHSVSVAPSLSYRVKPFREVIPTETRENKPTDKKALLVINYDDALIRCLLALGFVPIGFLAFQNVQWEKQRGILAPLKRLVGEWCPLQRRAVL